MAITFDAPSTNWQTASRVTSEPRINYPIPVNTSAIFYEIDMVQNQCDWTPLALDTVMASTQLDGGITSATTTVTVDATDGFPCFGKFKVGSEEVPYTGRTSTTFTGCTVAGSHSDNAAVTSVAILVGETAPAHAGGELVTWTRKYATVPDSWWEYSEAVFTFPGYYNDPYHANYRCPQAMNATIVTLSDYAKTSNPYTDLDVEYQMFRVVDADLCLLDYVDGSSVPTYTAYKNAITAADHIQAAQNSLSRYAGNIWVRMQHSTKAQ